MEPMAYIGAGMCALSMMAAAWGVSQVWTTIISIVGRNPQVKKDVDIYGWAGFAAVEADRKSTRLNSSHSGQSRMPSSA